MKRSIILLTILCLQSLVVFSQLSIQAEIRPRFELRDGYKNPSFVSSPTTGSFSQRSRICLAYETDKLQVFLSPQDVRIWGDETLFSSTGVYGDNASLSVFEAYAKIKTGKSGYLSIGRQALSYDQQRLLAKRNWNQNGLAYDALVWQLNLKETKLHIGSSWNSNSTIADNCYPSNRIKSLSFLWIEKQLSENLKVSTLHISTGNTQTDTTETLYFKQTSGCYLQLKTTNIELISNAYYQYGRNNSDQRANAFLLDAKLSYSWENIFLGSGTSILSGDKNLKDNTDCLFDPLYGARHRFFGHMDYFNNIEKGTNSGGLNDYFAFVGYKTNKNIIMQYSAHYFSLNKTNNKSPSSKKLGIENEISVKWKIYENVTFNAAYLFFLQTSTFKQVFNYNSNAHPQFFFLEININPKSVMGINLAKKPTLHKV